MESRDLSLIFAMWFVFLVLLIASPALAQRTRTYSQFELGGGASLLMPREEYNSGWGYGLDAGWNFSPTYGINLAFGSAQVAAEQGDSSMIVTSMVASLELSFRRRDIVTGFTNIGIGTVSSEENTIFVFGAGIKVPLGQKWLLRLELRDYHSEIGIPFATFPQSRVAIRGTEGSMYLEFGIGLSYTLGRTKPAYSGRRRAS